MIKTMRERGGEYGLLCCDEVSMIHSKMISCMERRIHAADLLEIVQRQKQAGHVDQINWAGLSVLFLGDMLQLQPPSNFAKSIYVDCVDETLGFDKFNKDTQLYHGVSIFRGFKKFELTTQNRASRDKGHTTMIHGLRTIKKPITPEMLKKLKPLGTDEMKSKVCVPVSDGKP